MSDLRELYQEVILDHRKKPRNFRKMDEANRTLEGYNPLCGDRVTVYLQMEDDVIKDASFQGVGCAIFTASASIMTELLKGRNMEEAEAIFQRFHDLVTGNSDDSGDLGKLAVFEGVSKFPLRVKCATLPWHTLRGALKQQEDAVTTE
jgi:nitrogen fixation NifU-like protein